MSKAIEQFLSKKRKKPIINLDIPLSPLMDEGTKYDNYHEEMAKWRMRITKENVPIVEGVGELFISAHAVERYSQRVRGAFHKADEEIHKEIIDLIYSEKAKVSKIEEFVFLITINRLAFIVSEETINGRVHQSVVTVLHKNMRLHNRKI